MVQISQDAAKGPGLPGMLHQLIRHRWAKDAVHANCGIRDSVHPRNWDSSLRRSPHGCGLRFCEL
jgi:hypothetical protein